MTLHRNILFDLFRVLAASAVAVYHFLLFESPKEKLFPFLVSEHPFFNWLKTVVLFFFILTAIVIPLHLANNRYTPRAYPVFFVKRLIRIHYPFLIVVGLTILSSIFFLLKNNLPISLDWKQLIGNITLTAEFMPVPWYNSIFWTLAIEMQFYILIGFIFPFLQRFEWKALIVLFVSGELLHYFFNDSRLVWFYTPYFCLGLVFYLYIGKKITQSFLLGAIIAFIGTTACMHEFVSLWVIVVFSFFMLLVKHLSSIWSYCAQFTYSFYLIHGLVGGHFLYFTHAWGNTLPIAILRFSLAFGSSVAAAWLFYHLVEKQSKKWMLLVRYRKN